MIYLPDTNVWIAFLNPGVNVVKHRMGAMPSNQIATCSVVKAELYFGAEMSARKRENTDMLDALFSEMRSLPFDDLAAQHYARVRAHLSATGTPIGPNDLMIAAIALANEMTLVTHNTDEFARVPDLVYEDWEQEA